MSWDDVVRYTFFLFCTSHLLDRQKPTTNPMDREKMAVIKMLSANVFSLKAPLATTRSSLRSSVAPVEEIAISIHLLMLSCWSALCAHNKASYNYKTQIASGTIYSNYNAIILHVGEFWANFAPSFQLMRVVKLPFFSRHITLALMRCL